MLLSVIRLKSYEFDKNGRRGYLKTWLHSLLVGFTCVEYKKKVKDDSYVFDLTSWRKWSCYFLKWRQRDNTDLGTERRNQVSWFDFREVKIKILIGDSRDIQRQLNIRGQEDLVFRDINLRIIIIDLSDHYGKPQTWSLKFYLFHCSMAVSRWFIKTNRVGIIWILKIDILKYI